MTRPVLLPVWQAEFGLGYAEVGMLRGSYKATMSDFQIPASLVAQRVNPILVLTGGTLLAAGGFILAGASTGFVGLLVALLLGSIGASAQHSIASSIVSSAFDDARSRAALGVYNFTGDVGKMLLPALTALLLTLMTWHTALWIVAGIGGVVAVLLLVLAPPPSTHTLPGSRPVSGEPCASRPRPSTSFGFRLLFSISLIDGAARMGFLTFLPFLLQAKGAAMAQIGLGLALVFAGGAVGKLVCAYLGARLGVLATVILTEGPTAAGILALLPMPFEQAFVLLPVIGIGLNGTSMGRSQSWFCQRCARGRSGSFTQAPQVPQRLRRHLWDCSETASACPIRWRASPSVCWRRSQSPSSSIRYWRAQRGPEPVGGLRLLKRSPITVAIKQPAT